MPHTSLLPGFRRIIFSVLFCCPLISCPRVSAQTPTPPAPAQGPPAEGDSAAKPAPSPPGEITEVSTHDNPATFKVRVNLVLVRAVVRDAHGKVVSNLKKEDFQLYDNRKLQAISSFSVESPESRTASAVASPVDASGSSSSRDAIAGKAVVLPQRFVSMVFDDIHLSMEDATFVRDSATRFLGSLAASDRVSINTTSGQLTREFTDDHDDLRKELLGIVPRQLTSGNNPGCPDVGYYQADLILNKNDSQSLAVATEDALQCAFGADPSMYTPARILAQSVASRVLADGDNETVYTYRHLDDIVRRLGTMPGQRVLVFVSPGFIPSTMQAEASGMVDRATRANIVINTIDARGLYTPDMGDLAHPPRDSLKTGGYKLSYRVAAQSAQQEVLAQLADGTGGTFFHNRNDVDEGMRQAAAAPLFSYLLGFSPQNLKIDGRYHALKVALTSKQKYTVQARHGYYAPRSIADPVEAAKEEIQEALFSQDEMHDLPVELQTQFFRRDEAQARLAVLTHVDIKGIRFRKADGRNWDNLTVAMAIFDENGNFVTGGEKIVEMRLLDKTFDRLGHSGF